MTVIILHVLVFLILEEKMKKVFVFVAVLLAALIVVAETSGDVQDQQACEYARKTRKIRIWKEYLKTYPNGACQFEARMKINNAARKKAKKQKKLENIEHGNLQWSQKVKFKADYDSAIKICQSLNKNGEEGWHLPTIEELRTLIINCPQNESGGQCVVDKDDCDGCGYKKEHSVFSDREFFWSSTPHKYVESNAWSVNFDNGGITFIGRSGEHNFRCVKDKNLSGGENYSTTIDDEEDDNEFDEEEDNSEKNKERRIVIINNEQTRYYRPYKGAGTALLVIGLLGDLLVADTLIICGAVYDSNKALYAGIATGIISLPMWITGAALLSKKRPVPDQNQKIELSNLSVAPTKGGVFTSVGFRF